MDRNVWKATVRNGWSFARGRSPCPKASSPHPALSSGAVAQLSQASKTCSWCCRFWAKEILLTAICCGEGRGGGEGVTSTEAVPNVGRSQPRNHILANNNPSKTRENVGVTNKQSWNKKQTFKQQTFLRCDEHVYLGILGGKLQPLPELLDTTCGVMLRQRAAPGAAGKPVLFACWCVFAFLQVFMWLCDSAFQLPAELCHVIKLIIKVKAFAT